MTLQDCITKYGLAPGSMIKPYEDSMIMSIDKCIFDLLLPMTQKLFAAVAAAEWRAECRRLDTPEQWNDAENVGSYKFEELEIKVYRSGDAKRAYQSLFESLRKEAGNYETE